MIKFSFSIQNESWCRIFNISRKFSATKSKLDNSRYWTKQDIPVFLNETEESINISNENDAFESKRNESGLRRAHYRMFHKKPPFRTEDELEVTPLWKYRKYYGRYGSETKVEMKCLWPSVYEMELMKEKESLEYPHSVQEMIRLAREQRRKHEDTIMTRQEEMKEKVGKLEEWKDAINRKIQKKEKDAQLALEVKQKQVDEVREIIGYQISPFDPKFKEVLDKKLEEDRKKAKKEKKLRKQQMILAQLTEVAKRDARMHEAEEDAKPDELYGKKIE